MLASLEQARAGERRFLADASHELRTPVTALLGNVEYAIRHGADAEVLADLRHDAERLARLVDSLLVLERAGGHGGASTERVALDELARRSMTPRTPGRVALGRGGRRWTVAGDSAALRARRQPLENGLVHGPAGGTVTVVGSRAGDGPADGQRCRARARIPPSTSSCSSASGAAPGPSERPGAGLGLAIVAAIAAQHDGRVLVDRLGFMLDCQLPVAD